MSLQLGTGWAMTVIAIGFLELDGVLLALAGLWRAEGGLAAVGVGLMATGALVLMYWRRHRRRLDEIMAVRREMKREAQALRELVKK